MIAGERRGRFGAGRQRASPGVLVDRAQASITENHIDRRRRRRHGRRHPRQLGQIGQRIRHGVNLTPGGGAANLRTRAVFGQTWNPRLEFAA